MKAKAERREEEDLQDCCGPLTSHGLGGEIWDMVWWWSRGEQTKREAGNE